MDLFHLLLGAEPKSILELDCGAGTTAAAFARAGHRVVGVDLIDRRGVAAPPAEGTGALRILRGDFYVVELDDRFDVVTYWNGFGIGVDADQRRLLRRIAAEWLTEDGTALIDVFNPLVWAS